MASDAADGERKVHVQLHAGPGPSGLSSADFDSESEIIVLPREVRKDGVGLYDESVVTLVKEFRTIGTSARYQHESAERTWIGERTGIEIAIAFVVGIASSAAWTGIESLLAKRYPSDQVNVKVARCRQGATETTWEWYEAEGRGEDVAEALAALEEPDDGSTSES